MRRLAFRHVLPIVQLALFVALWTTGEMQRRPSPEPATAGAVAWDLRTDQTPTDAFDICIAINAPAFLVFGWSAAFFPERFEWLSAIPVGLGVLIQWYFIGLWRDRRVGLLRSLAPGRPGRELWLAAVCALLLFAVIAGTAITLMASSWSEEWLFCLATLGWSGFAIALIVSKMRGWRSLARDAGDPLRR